MQHLSHLTDTERLSDVVVCAYGYTSRVERWRQLLADRWQETRRTLDELAADTGLNRGTIHRMLDGTTKEPGFESVVKVARALGVPLDLLSEDTRPADGVSRVERVAEGSSLLDRAITEAGARAGTWQADVADALHALARALGRERDRDADSQPPEAARR